MSNEPMSSTEGAGRGPMTLDDGQNERAAPTERVNTPSMEAFRPVLIAGVVLVLGMALFILAFSSWLE
jgi:hypothetical protein